MTCEFKAASHTLTRAKSLQVNEADVRESSSSEKSDITSIRAQLEQMSSILKGANYRSGNKSGGKQKANGKSAQPVNQQVYSRRVGSPSNAIGAVGGVITNKTVLIRSP